MKIEFPLNIDGQNKSEWECYERGSYHVQEDFLEVEGSWVRAADMNMKNIQMEFDACAPEDETQVQIWFGFRCASRDYRYTAALRGGSNNHLYLARMGAEGYDKMLDLCPLENSPCPGVWYHIRLICAGQKIAIYLGEEKQPRICVQDENSPFDAGSISLGGSYLRARFRNVIVQSVSEDALEGVEAAPDYLSLTILSKEEKESIRKRGRATYRPLVLGKLAECRQEISLDGKWLFIPNYESQELACALEYDDSKAHLMTVPSSWIPLKAWLEGESMGKLNKGMNDDYLVEEITRCGNQTFDYEKTDSAWYRHYIDFPKGMFGKKVVLDFEGIALVSEVYWNGKKVHENIGMFCPQQIDVSDYVKEGRNILAVKVWRRLPGREEYSEQENLDSRYATAWEILQGNTVEIDEADECTRHPFCTEDIAHGFYSDNPGGIWRTVRLIITNQIHVSECLFVPSLTDAKIDAVYENSSDTDCMAVLSYKIIHKTTGECLCEGIVEERKLAAGEKRTCSFSTPKISPRLWEPGKPNLYRLIFILQKEEKVADIYEEQVGFRTVRFEGQKLLYNEKPIWVRGGNHMPAHVRPNDAELAKRFMEMALEHHVMATRTHVAPWTSVWLDAADEAGLMVSFEGTWTWLMLEHIPSEMSIELWKEEFIALIKRHRNRPSLFLITMNNEMKFYLFDTPDAIMEKKGKILQEGVCAVRAVSPKLPLVIDSAYYRKKTLETGRYERIIQANGLDDGDMDDPHGYYGWYNQDFFHFMNGEFGRDYTVSGRPCMSQECATGYPRAQDGLPVRAYLFMHQTPQTTIGKLAYENNNPMHFLNRQGMLTKELAEVFRRIEHDRLCGVILFAFETWFYFQHDSKRIQPMYTAKALKMAYQPVLASAQLWNRHYFQGDVMEMDVTLINDSEDKRTLIRPQIKISLQADEKILAEQWLNFSDVPYFERTVQKGKLVIPDEGLAERTEAKLVLEIYEREKKISENEYDILIGSYEWGRGKASQDVCCYLEGDTEAERLLSWYQIPGKKILTDDIADGMKGLENRLIVAKPLEQRFVPSIRNFAEKGGKVLLFNQTHLAEGILGDIHAEYTEYRQEFVTMNDSDAPCFDGLEQKDLCWFADGENVPYAANGRYHVDRQNSMLTVLAETLEWHGYMEKPEDYRKFGGTPLFCVNMGKGSITVSTVRTDVCGLDPAASRLIGNVLCC